MATLPGAKTIDNIPDIKIEIKEEPVVNYYEAKNISKYFDKNLTIVLEANFSETHQNCVESKDCSYDSTNIFETVNDHEVIHYVDESDDVFIEESPAIDQIHEKSGDANDIKNVEKLSGFSEVHITEDKVNQVHEKSRVVINEVRDVETWSRSSEVHEKQVDDDENDDVFIEESPAADYSQNKLVETKSVAETIEKTFTTEDKVHQVHEKSGDVINEIRDVEKWSRSSEVHETQVHDDENDDIFIEESPAADYSQNTLVETKSVAETTEKTFTTEYTVDQIHEKLAGLTNVVIDVDKSQEKSGRSSEVHEKQVHDVNCGISHEANLLKAGKTKVFERRQEFVLNVILEKSIECEKRIHQQMFSAVQELFVAVKREDLHTLQKSYIDKYYRESDVTHVERLKWHRWHSNQPKPFWCRACPFAADHKFDLLIHMREKHKELAAKKKIPPIQNMCRGKDPALVWFKCTDCAYITKDKWVIERHLITHKQLHEVETFRCASCPYITKFRNSLVKHVKNHKDMSQIVFHRCPYCDFFTQNMWYLRNHVKFIHKKNENEYFKCPECSYKTVQKMLLKRHVLIHNKSRKLYKCPLCPFQSPYKKVLEMTHRLSHKGDEARIFECAKCSYKAKTKDNLKRHQLVHRRPDEVVMFKCDICPYETKHGYYIRVHRESHMTPDKVKIHSCGLCLYQGKAARNLKLHYARVHRDPKEGPMYKCDECPYQTRNSGNIKRHKLTHMKVHEIAYVQCDSCDYQAKSKYALKAHFNNVHKDPEQIRWYKCDKCEAKFKSKGNLKRHMWGHMDPSIVNVFHCHQCSFSTKAKDLLKGHMVKHMNVFLRCNRCKYQTKFRTNLHYHKQNHH